MEYFHCSFYALSVVLNALLLIIILLKSSKEIGMYKYLLFVFVVNDIVYANVHLIIRPIVSIHGEIHFLFSGNFPELRWVIAAFAVNHSHSFLLLSFHFVYRHIAIARHQLLHLFRTWWCLIFLLLCLIFESVIWFCLIFIGFKTDRDTFDKLIPYLEYEFPLLTIDGVATAHYWGRDGTLRRRTVFGTGGISLLMTFVLCIVIYCAVNIFRHLRKGLNSKKGVSLQRQLFYTLLVQFFVPVILMYTPVLFLIVPPLFHVSYNLPIHLISSLFVVFPFLDALVILIGVRDYRTALCRIVWALTPSRNQRKTTSSNLR